MTKKDPNGINLVIIDETALSIKVIINGVSLNVLQDDILAIKQEMRDFIYDCKQRKEKYDFRTLRNEKIKGRIGTNDEKDLRFIALQSLLSRSFSRKAKIAAASSRKSEKKREVMEKVAKEAAIPLQSAKQESLFGDDTSMLNRKAYREDLFLNPMGKKKSGVKKRP